MIFLALVLSLVGGAIADCGEGNRLALVFPGLSATDQPAALSTVSRVLAPNASTLYPLGITLDSSYTVVVGVNLSLPSAPPSSWLPGRTLLQQALPLMNTSSSTDVSAGGADSVPPAAAPSSSIPEVAGGQQPPSPGDSWGGEANGIHTGDWHGRHDWGSRCHFGASSSAQPSSRAHSLALSEGERSSSPLIVSVTSADGNSTALFAGCVSLDLNATSCDDGSASIRSEDMGALRASTVPIPALLFLTGTNASSAALLKNSLAASGGNLTLNASLKEHTAASIALPVTSGPTLLNTSVTIGVSSSSSRTLQAALLTLTPEALAAAAAALAVPAVAIAAPPNGSAPISITLPLGLNASVALNSTNLGAVLGNLQAAADAAGGNISVAVSNLTTIAFSINVTRAPLLSPAAADAAVISGIAATLNTSVDAVTVVTAPPADPTSPNTQVATVTVEVDPSSPAANLSSPAEAQNASANVVAALVDAGSDPAATSVGLPSPTVTNSQLAVTATTSNATAGQAFASRANSQLAAGTLTSVTVSVPPPAPPPAGSGASTLTCSVSVALLALLAASVLI